ncbi:sulfite exporter TauE/SafE family protein [Photobacterium ganghwense]|uniref:Probable membrane transporter protein n=2 Tax=Photobacterium ganghwense TaxID=320778 RepID=A0A0J1HAS7_9GAMM|nr:MULTISPECIES: sulfite exporter TauE/SafE family protein [Photobacterium]KLV08753.1 permease [Photobacterium ganghwense]PSU10880.1 sulfite exporter TauE/SafE family protein [Photobacterium ganghwense]QSV12983.1 sulfite exporter TauE/SafE family protein [Photobacterium ganghwense]
MDISWFHLGLLVSTGFLAGIINTLAGGGSNLTLPALMVMGMPAEVANATNRVGVVLQGLTALLGFRHHGKLDASDTGGIMVPTIIGGLLGAAAAAYAPAGIIKPLLLGTMLSMALIILLKPAIVAPPPGTEPRKVKDTPSSWWGLGLAGFYGGFVQAGVGFVLLAALAGTLRYDLVRANALKMLCTLVFTVVALALFVMEGLVMWIPGLVLAVGTMVGSHLAVKFAIRAKPETLKWFLFVMTLCGCVAAMLT